MGLSNNNFDGIILQAIWKKFVHNMERGFNFPCLLAMCLKKRSSEKVGASISLKSTTSIIVGKRILCLSTSEGAKGKAQNWARFGKITMIVRQAFIINTQTQDVYRNKLHSSFFDMFWPWLMLSCVWALMIKAQAQYVYRNKLHSS